MKQKRRIFVGVLTALLIFFVIIWTFVPRISNTAKDDFSPITAEEYPVLYQAYQQLLEDNSLSRVIAEDVLRIVTVKNLWSSCEYYILPCYIVDLNTVPHAGSVNWNASVYILAVCSDESAMVSKLSSLQVRDFKLEMEPGANTFISSYVDILPGDAPVDDPYEVTLQAAVDCLRDPQITVFYSAGTSESAQERDVGTLAYFHWNYRIYCCGKLIVGYQNRTVYQDYIVNA